MKVLAYSVAAVALLATAAGAQAQSKKYTLALVPKNMNNPFFDQARDGCKKAEKELNGAIECLYIGPGEHGGGEEQVQVINDLIAKKAHAGNWVKGASTIVGGSGGGRPDMAQAGGKNAEKLPEALDNGREAMVKQLSA